MKIVCSLAILALPCVSAFGADKAMSIEEIAAEFKKDANEAKSKYLGHKVQVEIEIEKRVVDNNKTYHQVKAGDIPKGAKVLFKLPKLYRATDKLLVTATLKISSWDKAEQRLFFDPAEVDKEIQILPPLFTSTQLLQTYLKSQEKVSEEYVGKTIDISGIVRFRSNGGVVLEYLPKTNAKGKIEHDIDGYELLGRPLVTVRFADDSIQKAALRRGTAIQARGTVSEMKAGSILIKDATLTK